MASAWLSSAGSVSLFGVVDVVAPVRQMDRADSQSTVSSSTVISGAGAAAGSVPFGSTTWRSSSPQVTEWLAANGLAPAER
jgi:hypothetical protein